MFSNHSPTWSWYLSSVWSHWEMIRGRPDYYHYEDGEDDYDFWCEMYDDPEQDSDGGARLEPWELFDEDGEAASSEDWVA
jgi:hypothetical protein